MPDSPLRIVFAGTPLPAVPSLRALLADPRFDVVGVFTQPARPAGRGQALMQQPVYAVAQEAGIPIYQPEKVREAELEILKSLRPDFLVVVAYGHILSDAFLAVPTLAPVNLHFSLLPRWRGAAPVQPCILHEERESGYCYVRMVRALDAGPVYAAFPRVLTGRETAGELYAEYAMAGGANLPDVLAGIADGTYAGVAQDETQATCAPKIYPSDGAIDWLQDTAWQVMSKLRAYAPRPGIYTYWQGKRLKIVAADVLVGQSVAAGRVVQVGADVAIGCAEHTALRVMLLQLEGKSVMRAEDFVRGAVGLVGGRVG